MAGGDIGFGKTDAETTTGVTPLNLAYEPGDVRRYGVLPNNPASASINSAQLQALLDPTKVGPRGTVEFFPESGNDTYYFDGPIQIRPGVKIKLNGCRILFVRAAVTADQTMGCFTIMRDVEIDLGGGTLEAQISGVVGTNALPLLRIGSRTGSKFGTFTGGVCDKDDLYDAGLPAQGNVWIHNGTLKTNNPSGNCSVIVLMLGGIHDVTLENLRGTGNGNSGPETFVYYEMGDGSKNGQPAVPARWSTSSAKNLRCIDISARNLKTSGATSDGAIVSIVEAASFEIDGIYGDGTTASLVCCRLGEGHFFREWTGAKIGRGKISRIRGTSTATAIVLNGAQGTAVGQFSDANMIASGQAVLTAGQKVDKMAYELDDFEIAGTTGNGITVEAPAIITNGCITGFSANINLLGDASFFDITNVWCLANSDVTNGNIRSDTDSPYFSRPKRGRISNCKIAGGKFYGLTLAYADGVEVTGNQWGYNVARGDPANESLQQGVLLGATAINVRLSGNTIKVASGAAYTKTSGPGGCYIVDAHDTRSVSGVFMWAGMPIQNNINFAAPTNIDCANGMNVYLNVNGGGAFTINAPLNPMIGTLNLTVLNTSGGAMGAITWNAIFRLAGAFTNPANGKQRTISFVYDGSSRWSEFSRTAADVTI